MRIGMVVAANKYTGAAAVAEHGCRALRSVGVDARLLFVAGRNLERRLADRSWAAAGLVKERTPLRALDNLSTIRRFTASCTAVISHLPHDTVLCIAAGSHRRVPLIRNFRNSRHLRRDPWHRALARRMAGMMLANSSLEEDLRRLAPTTPRLTVPVPVDDRFRPGRDGTGWRVRLGIPPGTPVLGMVGKIAPGRGFDLLLETAARLRSPAHVVAVGHGEAQPRLRELAGRLEIGDRVHWTGYQDDDLPVLLGAMDVVLFAAPGSDHGHRAISEAQACGRPVVAARLPGVEDLVQDRVTGRLVEGHASELASAVDELLSEPGSAALMGEAAARTVSERRFERVGHRVAAFLEALVRGHHSRARR